MSGEPVLRHLHDRQRVVPISLGRRRHYSQRPSIEPPLKVVALTASIPDEGRFVITEADILADTSIADLGLTLLRKCNYVLDAAPGAIRDPHFLELMLGRTVRIIGEYGEPEGLPLLNRALGLSLDKPYLREELSRALALIGDDRSAEPLISLLEADIASPAAHLTSLMLYADRYPELTGAIIGRLQALSARHPGIPDISRAIEDIRQGIL
jgi:hypothetical protein